MFSRFLLTVLMLTSIVFSQTLSLTKNTINFFLKNSSIDDLDCNFFYIDAASKLCSLNIKKDSIREIIFSNVIPVLWQGTRTVHLSNYDQGTIARGTVISYDGGWTKGTQYICFFIKNNFNDLLHFSYTHPSGSRQFSIAAGLNSEIVCALPNNTVSCTESGLSISSVNFGDRLMVGGSSAFSKSGSYISFWIRNTTATAKTFRYIDADINADSITIMANGIVEVNYVRPSSSVSTNGLIYTNLQKGDLITYSTTGAVEVSATKNIHLVSTCPNPFSSMVTISLWKEADINIFSLSGQKVASYKNTRATTWTPLSEASGVYIVKVNTGEQVFSERVYFAK